MRRLSSIILLVILTFSLYSQSPHGPQLSIPCADCHNPNGWKLVAGTYSFKHNSTKFPLVGQHEEIDCKMCHTSLVFSKADPLCMSCHEDMHFQTVGFECARCHTPNSWIVNNTTELHQQSRFPLVGAHLTAECVQCHPSASLLRFEPLGVECVDCHEADYLATTNPNHVESNFSTNCQDCHSMNSFTWGSSDFNHSFFPLTQGHDINNCSECHTNGDFANTSSECVSCHETDYNETDNPNHASLNFSAVCTECHSTVPGWSPAEYQEHDAQFFPIYSGKHNNEWNSCTDCHTNPSDYASFTCIDCHEHNQGDTDKEHDEVGGYIYNSTSCYECHPTGNAEDGFDHNASNFPLTGAHITTECIKCHESGFAGTTTICGDCHISDFNQSTNPNHLEANISTECADCHTTDPDWAPATFTTHNDYYALTGGHATISSDCFACHAGDYNNTPTVCFNCHTNNYNQTSNPNHNAIGIDNVCETCHTTAPEWKPAAFPTHNNYYELAGAHVAISTDCNTCHNGDYNNTPNTCYACHTTDYNQTSNPPHQTAQFPTDCETCHTQTLWVPATFNHDGEYFPIYSGKHNDEWDQCSECHQNPSNYTEFTCLTCHKQAETNDEHQGMNGYQYASEACLACHPDGSAGDFNHNNTNFPLTGAHTTTNCVQCHENGYSGTSTVCSDCHQSNFDQSTNPNHTSLNIPNECATCHTTIPGWEPATFPIHNNYYVLQGAHITIENECVTCHDGNYNNTPNTCYACHVSDYNQTNNPPHQTAQFPTDCETCHSQNAWNPSTFDHDGQYFPIYSGKHNDEWNQCSECHQNPSNYAEFTCLTCHQQAETNNDHEGVGGYSYNSEACYACHPTGNGDDFNHDNTNFPLTGAHSTVDCNLCHENGYDGTSTICSDCHQDNYNQSTNPNHVSLNIPTECANCHTTNPDWNPATFDIHDNYYQLTGGHATISDDCAACHEGDYNNTPTVCFTCHTDNYNESANPNHVALNIPTECADCHTTNPDWNPASFGIHNNYYVLDGAHIDADCYSCHNGDYNNTTNVCFNCHTDNYNESTNPNHVALSIPTECADCHTTNPDWNPATFDIHNNYFVLDGAHVNIECATCHNDDYNNTSSGCYDCHTDDYTQSTNPNHVALSIPTECSGCHTTNPDWNPATFDIHNDYYVLSGAHLAVADQCVTCHNGNYNSTPNTCYGCHQSDYEQTNDPNHLAAQFPTDCEMCHTQNVWDPSTFNHDSQYFPIYSGEHNGEWDQCIDCHTNPADYSVFTCLTCHSQNETNNDHQDVSGYQYNSNACYSCHPNGSEDGKKMRMNIKKVSTQ